MATKKHKKRKRDTRTEEQKAQSARDLAPGKRAIANAEEGGCALSFQGQESRESQGHQGRCQERSQQEAQPLASFRQLLQRGQGRDATRVWPTRPELVNASLIVVGALVFFGVGIAIIDNIIIIPLDAIATLGVTPRLEDGMSSTPIRVTRTRSRLTSSTHRDAGLSRTTSSRFSFLPRRSPSSRKAAVASPPSARSFPATFWSR